MSNLDATALDDPVGESPRGHHAHLARLLGRAVTYQPDVATFSSVTKGPHAEERADLAKLLSVRGQGRLPRSRILVTTASKRFRSRAAPSRRTSSAS